MLQYFDSLVKVFVLFMNFIIVFIVLLHPLRASSCFSISIYVRNCPAHDSPSSPFVVRYE